MISRSPHERSDISNVAALVRATPVAITWMKQAISFPAGRHPLRAGGTPWESAAGSFIGALAVLGSAGGVYGAGGDRNMPHPFRIETDPALVARLLDRVRTAHFPKLSSGAGWKYGVDAAWFAELVRYWGSTYKWDEAERRLNRYAQYRAEIDGRQLHFVRLEPSSGATARRWPALLLHGWPYTFATMLPLGERLSQAGFRSDRAFLARDGLFRGSIR